MGVVPASPLASVPVAFFDARTGLSALAIQHLRTDGRVVLLFHDAPGPAAAHPLLSAIAETMASELGAGQTLTMIESSMPEHPAETFVYARVSVTRVPGTASTAMAPGGRGIPPSTQLVARLSAHQAGALSARAVANLCGITDRELGRTEVLVVGIHRPRRCAFPGFRQLPLGRRDRAALRVVA